MTTFRTHDPLKLGQEVDVMDVGGLVAAAAGIADSLCPGRYVVSLEPAGDGFRLEVYLVPAGVVRTWSVSHLLKAADPIADLCHELAAAHVRATAEGAA